MSLNATKVVTSAMLGLDGETIIVNGKAYYVLPPTIKKIAGMGYYLSDFGDEERISDFIRKSGKVEDAARALSWLIQGDESLFDELSEGTLDEVCDGLETGINLIGTGNFLRLSALSKSVRSLTANQLQ